MTRLPSSGVFGSLKALWVFVTFKPERPRLQAASITYVSTGKRKKR